MKTADLIPFILLELDESDKYGFELTKQIETKSNGKIVIKQPTLYTLLKKLEKSKFITSYWQDSEIGGKRHYYKITENGRMQVSTLPDYNVLMSSALSNEESENQGEETEIKANIEKTEKNEKEPIETSKNASDNLSIFDIIDEPKETILPSEEVFTDSSIDTTTTFETNSNNTNILNDNDDITSFVENENVAKFAKTAQVQSQKFEEEKQIEQKNEIHNFKTTTFNNESIKYVDYINFVNDPTYKKAKQTAQNMLYRTLSTSGYLLFMLILCGIVVGFTGGSPLYYTFLIVSICVAIFYPSLYLLKYDNFRQKHKETSYVLNTNKLLIIYGSVFAFILILTLVTNFAIGVNFVALFNINNFANFYAPILLSSVLFMDVLFAHIFMSMRNK